MPAPWGTVHQQREPAIAILIGRTVVVVVIDVPPPPPRPIDTTGVVVPIRGRAA